jgi:hypothetical protein
MSTSGTRILRAHGMSVISIQSQVAFGHVGNGAAVFPMQMHGIDVIAVPTTFTLNYGALINGDP